jgi:hypothetical protein
MNNSSTSIIRLLNAAATVPAEPGAEMPFGFDTRVLAQWRATWPTDAASVAKLLRRVVLMAMALIILAGAGAYRDWQGDDPAEPFGDEFAMADTAIGGVIDQ